MFAIKTTAVRVAGSVGTLLAGTQMSRLCLKFPSRKLKDEAGVLSPCVCFGVIPGGQIRKIQRQQAQNMLH
jgi:hypothetical protein